MGAFFTYTRALKRQKSTQARQPVHFSGSKNGRAVVTALSRTPWGRQKRRPLGSSTSQSM